MSRLQRIVAASPAAACRCAATTSTPTGSCRRGFCARSSFEGLEQHLFEDDRAGRSARTRSTTRATRGASILRRERELRLRLVARARAAGARARCGIRAIVGESFSEIFSGQLGRCSACRASPRGRDDVERLQTLDRAATRRPRSPSTCDAGRDRGGAADDRRRRCRRRCATHSSSGQWNPTAMLLDRFDEVDAVAARLPYVSGF